MRSTIAAATFVALGAGTLGVGALDQIAHMTGSDTLKAITIDVIAACGTNCAGLTYDGTGSGVGQSALTAGTQSVAPMSRALNNGVCSNAGRDTAEGAVMALDGVNVVGNENRVCNGTIGADFSSTQGLEPGANWRNALRIIYAGMPTGQDDILVRDCNSAARRALVSSWDDIFKGDCTGKDCNVDTHPSADGATPALRYDRFNNVKEPGLRHAFRRDEESGTTDVFLGLLGLPTVNFAQALPTSSPAAGCPTGCQTNQATAFKTLANSPFCNVRRPTDTWAPVTVPSWTNPDGSVKSNAEVVSSITAGTAKIIPEVVNLGAIPTPTATPPAVPHAPFTGWDNDNNAATAAIWAVLPVDVYYPEMQDQDPVRRKCAGTNAASSPTLGAEQVCSADAHLGLVLPINPPPVAATVAYPVAACTGFAQKAKALVKGNLVGVLCPDGSPAVGAPAECLMPVINATGSCACMSRGGAWGDNTAADQVPVYTPLGGPAGSVIDGRVYNLQLRDADCTVRTINRPNPAAPTGPLLAAQMAGSFYRIHSSKTLLPPPTATSFNCQKTDATRQIGCLVQANPCSIGFAGGEAVDDNADLTASNGIADATVGICVNGVCPAVSTIRHLVDGGTPVYPFARKLYVNTLRGFANPIADATLPAVDGETEFVRAFVAGVAPGGSSIPEDFGFVSIVGGPLCEDYNETGLCPTQSGCTTSGTRTTCTHENTASCSDVVAGIPSGSTARCGDGVTQVGEACDDGNLITDTAAAPADPTDDKCSVNCVVTN
jgi:hypothetical protein